MPRISRVDAFIVEARVRGVFRIAYSETRVVRNVYVRLELDDGTVGWGEAAPSLLITGETPETVLSLVEHVSGLIRGLEVPGEEGDAINAISTFLASHPSARAALESALLDAMARRAGVPLCTLLGGCRRLKLETFYTISLDEPDVMAEAAKRAVESGFSSLKLKLGGPRYKDLERVKRVREAVGWNVRIIVDANQAWSLSTALWLIPRLADLGVELVEQPLPRHDLRSIAELSRRSEVEIAVDESVTSIADLQKLLEYGFRGVVNAKISRVGGPLQAKRILDYAYANGLEGMVGCMLETGIGLLHAVHLAYASAPAIVDLDAQLLLEEDPSGCTVYEKPPMLVKPGGPGIGCIPSIRLSKRG